MNLHLGIIFKFLSKKIFLQIYFFLFILLNIFDFLNYLPADIDFFKKLLSWGILGYLFYRLSPSKIFIGKRHKKYDIFFIIGFSLISITKSLVLYTRDGIYNSQNFYLFKYILTPISNIQSDVLLLNSFLIGLVVIILTSIILIKNNRISKKSFLGSFNFSKYLKFIKIEYITLILFSIFFGLIIFNFFMEWFALAVDSIILVLGLIFYIFKYFHDHSKNKFSNYLRIISNTGNNFYTKLIMAFSNKKTLFIGISFLLTIHLIVDIGVYMVPYTIGTQNSLYFNSLSVNGQDHTPLFNFINFENSQIYKDLTLTKDPTLIFVIILIYLFSSFLVISLLFLPFYVFYKNIQKEKVKLNNWFSILFLISASFFLMITFLPNIVNPISITKPNVENINGVDISTNQITKNLSQNSINKVSSELFVSIILFLTITIFLLFRYSKYKFFFDKLILILILAFFVYYIFIFFSSTIDSEYNKIFPKITTNFDDKNNLYLNKQLYSETKEFSINFKKSNLVAYPFSDLNLSQIGKNKIHKDYLFIKINNNYDFNIKFENLSNVYFDNNSKYSNYKFENKEIKLIYYLGENYFTVNKIKRGYKISNNLDNNKILNILNINSDSYKNLINKFIEYLRLIFISLFYILGTLAFIYHYTKTNLLKN